MKERKIIAIAIYLIMMWGFGFIGGYIFMEDKYQEQKYINEIVYKAYEELRNSYDVLEIQYKRDLESCYTQFGDYQDRVEAGCYINGGWNCE